MKLSPPAASILEALVDLVDEGVGGHISVHPNRRFVDHHRVGDPLAPGRTIRTMRADDTGSVLSGDLWEALRSWSASGDQGGTFEFHAAGRVYPSAVTAVTSRLARFRHGCPTSEDFKVVVAAGLDGDLEFLGRVRLRIRPGVFSSVADESRWRVGEIVKCAGKNPMAVDVVLGRLVEHLEEIEGSDAPAFITCDDMARMIGVTQAARTSSEIELDGVLSRYRRTLIDRFATENATLGLAAATVARQGSLPVVVRCGLGVSQPVQASLRREVARITGEYLRPWAMARVLACPTLVLLVELSGESDIDEEFDEEISEIAAANPSIKLLRPSRS